MKFLRTLVVVVETESGLLLAGDPSSVVIGLEREVDLFVIDDGTVYEFRVATSPRPFTEDTKMPIVSPEHLSGLAS